jgi:transposase
VSTATVELLDIDTARRLTAQARDALAIADDVLARLYAGRVWLAYGHAGWAEYCAAELPELRHLKMRTGPRRERVAALHAQGASVRDIAAATGASVGSVHGDIATLTRAAPDGGTGGTQSRRETSGAAHVRVAAVVAAAGAAGLTIPQVQRRLGWSYGATSGALSRAERRGLVTRPLDLDRRGGFRPYTGGSSR